MRDIDRAAFDAATGNIDSGFLLERYSHGSIGKTTLAARIVGALVLEPEAGAIDPHDVGDDEGTVAPAIAHRIAAGNGHFSVKAAAVAGEVLHRNRKGLAVDLDAGGSERANGAIDTTSILVEIGGRLRNALHGGSPEALTNFAGLGRVCKRPYNSAIEILLSVGLVQVNQGFLGQRPVQSMFSWLINP